MVKLRQVNRMHRNYFLIIVAAALFCLFLIFFAFWWEIKTPVAQENLITPTEAPFKSSISGVGIVEPSSESIAIGAPMQRIVRKVFVTSGQKVQKGDLLFFLENRDLKADLRAQEAAYLSAVARLKKLESYPRPEDLVAAMAAEKSARDEMESAKKQNEMVLNLPDPKAISQQEKDLRYYNYKKAEANLVRAEAELEKVKSGTWKPDLDIARHEVVEARMNYDTIKAKYLQTFVRAPIDGTVLQVKIHEGEMPSLDSQNPLMLLGNIDEKFLRVSINQLDIPLFHTDAPAEAFLRGHTQESFPLEYVCLEPLLVNKKNITHEISETVDTRVLQIVYLLKKDSPKLFIGQPMDVYIETRDR